MIITKHSDASLGTENGDTRLPHLQPPGIQPAPHPLLAADRIDGLPSTSTSVRPAGRSAKALCLASLLCTVGLVRPATADVFDCTQDISETCLRESLNSANQNGQSNTILLGAGTYQLTRELPHVTSPLTIRGGGAGVTQIHGICTADKKINTVNECHSNIPKFRILTVERTGSLMIDQLTIADGQAGSNPNGGAVDANSGGGVLNYGSLEVYRSTIKDNYALYSGGGIAQLGSWLYLQDSTVTSNGAANGWGGGIFVQSGKVEIRYSAINNNRTLAGAGAGLVNGFSGRAGVVTIVNSTISGNVDNGLLTPAAVRAGGILNSGDGQVWLKSVTITNNMASGWSWGGAGGVYNDALPGYSRGGLYLSNTIIARNGISPDGINGNISDCGGTIITLGGNLIGIANFGATVYGNLFGYPALSCAVVPPDKWDSTWPARAPDLIGHNKILDPQFEEDANGRPLLKDNGGTSCSHALQGSSPAINAAWTGTPGSHGFACEMYDQRWIQRDNALDPQGLGCDIGAFEFRPIISPAGLGCTN